MTWAGVHSLTHSTAAGTANCAGGYAGSLEHEDTDAADWASWGIDCETALDDELLRPC